MLFESEIFIVLCIIISASRFGMSCASLDGLIYVPMTVEDYIVVD